MTIKLNVHFSAIRYATIGDNDDDLEVADISTLMEDKKLLSSYDKCFVFYAIFK